MSLQLVLIALASKILLTSALGVKVTLTTIRLLTWSRDNLLVAPPVLRASCYMLWGAMAAFCLDGGWWLLRRLWGPCNSEATTNLPMVEPKMCLMWRLAALVAAVLACLICVCTYATLSTFRQDQHEESGMFMYRIQDFTVRCSLEAAV